MKRIIQAILASMFVLFSMSVTGLLSQPGFGAEGTVHRVTGEVVAVNTSETPHVIVVKAMIGKEEDMIVGATVGQDVPITRRGKPVGLAALKVGESVVLTYVKNRDGLVAKEIHAR